MKLAGDKERDYHLGDFAALLTFVICLIKALYYPEVVESIIWWLAVGAGVVYLWISQHIKIHSEGAIGHFVRFFWFLAAGVFLLLLTYYYTPRVLFYLVLGLEIAAALAMCFALGRKTIRELLNRISQFLHIVSWISQLGALICLVILLVLRFFLPEEKRDEYRWWIYGISLLLAIYLFIILVRKSKSDGKKRAGRPRYSDLASGAISEVHHGSDGGDT